MEIAMVQPHPSLLLVLDIDESLATEETRLEVGRCYGYVGSTVIRPHETPADGAITNTMHMHVKLPGLKYLRENTDEANELWNQVVERWLFNQFHTVGNQMQIYNRRQREEGNLELYFDWLAVILENGAFTVRIRLNSVSSLPPECSQVVAQIRQALADGLIGEDVDCVYVPSPDSFEAQVKVWEEGEPEREAARLEAERKEQEEAEAAQAAAISEAEENFDEAPDLAEPREEIMDEESWQAELERKYALPEPDFEIDYSIWGVPDEDGALRAFDSETHRYIDTEEVKGSFVVAEAAL